MSDLIYDIGMHEGEDSKFYLAKGFRVVAVEADPLLCEQAADRLGQFIQSGQLTIVNRAIAPTRGPIILYRCDLRGWSTIDPDQDKGNIARGRRSEPVKVEAITMAELVGEYGDALYMKIDIEGMDRQAVQSLAATAIRPKYLSMETTFARYPTFDEARKDLDALAGLAYDRFKIVDQRRVSRQVPPQPALIGNYVPYSFDNGESGLFGDETPGEWLTLDQSLAFFARLMRKKWLQVWLHPRLPLYLRYSAIIHRLTGIYPSLGWYDIHARHSTVG
jgi:FkbM family methyltransferase